MSKEYPYTHEDGWIVTCEDIDGVMTEVWNPTPGTKSQEFMDKIMKNYREDRSQAKEWVRKTKRKTDDSV
ncbi:hypothetical protein PBI_GRAYSON_123 [Rhodococcus phage Grayson]|nr:hypothetical protein PBI_GRAYSON_123 [Rhodococcus phage Grayson]